MPNQYQLDILSLYDPDHAASTVNVWVAHPAPSEATALGLLFSITEIETRERLNHDVISLLQEELRANYYSQIERTPELAFETALQQTNRRIHELALEGVGDWSDRANIIVGVLTSQHLFLVSVGRIHAYLVRQSRIHPLAVPSSVKPNPLRIFDHVINGRVLPSDRLLFCTSSLLDNFSLEKLRRTLLDYTPSQAVRQLENALLGAEPRVAFGALVIELATASDRQTSGSSVFSRGRPASPQQSMDVLVTRERTTEKLLAPSIWPAVRDVGQQIVQGVNRFTRRVILRLPVRRTLPTTRAQPSASRPRSTSITPLPQRLTGLAQHGASGTKRLFQTIASVMHRRPSMTTVRYERRRWGWSAVLSTLINWYRRLPGTQQRVVIGLLAVIFLLSFSLSQNVFQPSTRSAASTHETLAQVDEQLSQAEAALIYGGDDIVQDRLSAAQQLVESLPDRSKDDQAVRDKYQASIRQLERQANRIVEVKPVKLIDVSSLQSQRPSQLYRVGSRLISADPGQNLVAIVSPTEEIEPSVSSPTLDLGTIQTGTAVDDRRIVFATDRKTFIQFDVITGEWIPLKGELPSTENTIQALASYQSRVYVLDAQKSAILRFNRTASALSGSASWLRESVDIHSARAIAIDGSIYILLSGGSVEQYFGGRRNDFSLNPVQPKLSGPTRIWTDAEAQYIYLLEPKQRRIVVYDKSGKLLKQLHADSWSKLQDLAVDEKLGTVYVVNGSTVEYTPLNTE